MTHAANVVVPSAQTARDLSIVLWIIQSTICTDMYMCAVLRLAQG
jgi:hypothetical protein